MLGNGMLTAKPLARVPLFKKACYTKQL